MMLRTSTLLAGLNAWDTPALSNALRLLTEGPHNEGFTDATVPLVVGGKDGGFCGYAVTATMRAREDGDDAIPVAELHRAILAQEGPVAVVIEDLDDPPGRGAFLGEVNGTLLAALGVSGVVTNGRVRDAPELRRLGYSVHAAGLCVSRSYMRLTAVGVPVRVGGLRIEPGDILRGDEHGVLRVPEQYAERLPAVAEDIRGEEQRIVTWAASSEFSAEGLLALKRVKH
jgi:4-hydroxy-4-methyl-2-oxoglutarate aldolase